MPKEVKENWSEAVGVGFGLLGGVLVLAASWHDFLFGFRLCPGSYAMHLGPFSLVWFADDQA